MIAEPMPAAPSSRRKAPITGKAKPRIAPPPPARSGVPAFAAAAESMGITLMPWQLEAARYLTARGPEGRHLYSEVAIVVARQQGKTTLMKPLIVEALRAGKRVMHMAQNRELPRIMFGIVADALSNEPDLFPRRRGKVIWPRYGAGQEEIVLQNGGVYRIAASNRGGARGHSNDLLIYDELREVVDWEPVQAAEATLGMSPDPQRIWLSNAGSDASVVLNAIRKRALEESDPTLAYLEWSAAPERAPDDRQGWAEANPAMGHYPQVERNLEEAYRKVPLPVFEVERLCRWVTTMMPRVVDDIDWQRVRAPLVEMSAPAMGIAVDSEGRRASAVVAWMSGGFVYVRSFAEAGPAEPIDLDAFARDLLPLARKHGVRQVGFDPWWDRDLARHFKDAKAINGADYAAACKRFVSAIETGQLRHDDAGAITGDLAYTVRKDTTNGWLAVRSNVERPTTASLAAIRAVWLATTPGAAKPKIF